MTVYIRIHLDITIARANRLSAYGYWNVQCEWRVFSSMSAMLTQDTRTFDDTFRREGVRMSRGQDGSMCASQVEIWD